MPTAYAVGSLGDILCYERRRGGIHASLWTGPFIFEVSCRDGFWLGLCCQLGSCKRYSCCFTHCRGLMIGLKTSRLVIDLRPVELTWEGSCGFQGTCLYAAGANLNRNWALSMIFLNSAGKWVALLQVGRSAQVGCARYKLHCENRPSGSLCQGGSLAPKWVARPSNPVNDVSKLKFGLQTPDFDLCAVDCWKWNLFGFIYMM